MTGCTSLISSSVKTHRKGLLSPSVLCVRVRVCVFILHIYMFFFFQKRGDGDCVSNLQEKGQEEHLPDY